MLLELGISVYSIAFFPRLKVRKVVTRLPSVHLPSEYAKRHAGLRMTKAPRGEALSVGLKSFSGLGRLSVFCIQKAEHCLWRRASGSEDPTQNNVGGERGIRTLETREGLPVFKTGAFNRSATSPSTNLFRPVGDVY